ncbi:class I SAM-dependent methyltransferase [Calothrix sp. FACHB-1219]|uniref:class I SAM-dependent methyltransferase n=1 Tax=unclassified Calothrix TaxID=2619626 RepID=UPI001682B43E|nr:MULTISPECIES: class I SAM-dependent methyltransferase [unclassified Calothrix]MBD2203954.1 class I SAM-dependent methyltransferase [Calothrix sp. FACHB-168]MBD2218261.1 class I SAM-dependent methyltransferase [Calothrix sp. FACHB-1219]
MGFYSQFIAPRLIDAAMSSPTLSAYRREILADVTGEVLEIGFGSGVNLSYYPEHLQKLITIDANPGINKLAQKRIQSSHIQVDNRVLNSENLPMADHTFDSVVSTFCLCSITNVSQAINEIYRVLKPGGRYFFLEHGLSDELNIQVWQHRLNSLSQLIGDGCNINRNIRQLVAAQFANLTVEQFYIPKIPKISGYLYKGVAVK